MKRNKTYGRMHMLLPMAGLMLFLQPAVNTLFAQNEMPAFQDEGRTPDRFQAGLSDENLWMHSDRTKYIAGETIWFSCYLLRDVRSLNQSTSKVAYVELLNSLNMPILQQKVLLSEGTGPGQLMIPDTVSSGYYLFRSYTSAMKNRGPAGYYSQVIEIYNPFKKPIGWRRNLVNDRTPVRLSFFPEGGKLIGRTENNVVVLAQDVNGLGIPVEGLIFNQHGDSSGTFVTDSSGLGSFLFTPDNAERYECRIPHNGSGMVYHLPPAEAGIAIQVDPTDPLLLRVRANAQPRPFPSDYRQIRLVVLFGGTIRYQDVLDTEDLLKPIAIPKALLSEGIHQVVLLDVVGRPLANRLVYIPVTEKNVLELEVADRFQPRERVELKMQLDTNEFKPSELRGISISVAVLTRSPIPGQMGLYHAIGSDLLDPREAEMFIMDLQVHSPEIADMRLMTLQSYRYPFDHAENTSEDIQRFPREDYGMYVTGSLVERGSGQPVGNELLYLSFPGRATMFHYAPTDPDGNFRFLLPEHYGTQDLVIQPARLVSEEIRINIDNPFSLEYLSWSGSWPSTFESPPEQARQWSVNFQLQRIYLDPQDHGPSDQARTDPGTFYGTPDKSVELDDFIILPVMEEVFHELVFGVRLRKVQSDYEFVILDNLYNTAMEGTPAVFLDGVYVHDPNQIAEIHPEQIDRIEVVRETYQVGDVVMDGIISMYTKDGDFNLIEPPITAVRRRYPLFSRPESFISPDHSEAGSKDSRIPDMRNTLFWAPQVAFDSAGLASVHFFTGDVKSDFEILVQGVTRWGEVVCSRKIFTVE